MHAPTKDTVEQQINGALPTEYWLDINETKRNNKKDVHRKRSSVKLSCYQRNTHAQIKKNRIIQTEVNGFAWFNKSDK